MLHQEPASVLLDTMEQYVTRHVARDHMAQAVVANVPVRMQLVSVTESQGSAPVFQDGWEICVLNHVTMVTLVMGAVKYVHAQMVVTVTTSLVNVFALLGFPVLSVSLSAQKIILAYIAVKFVSVRMELTVHRLMVSVTAQLVGLETLVIGYVQTIHLVMVAPYHVTVVMEVFAIHSQDIAGVNLDLMAHDVIWFVLMGHLVHTAWANVNVPTMQHAL